MKHRKVSI